jgi:glycosyltransferase involved in cell wall biosynthesis
MRGGQWQALYLMERLAAMGHEQELLALTRSPLKHETDDRSLATAPLSVSALTRRRGRFDLIHAHDARAHALAAPFGRGRLIVARRVAFALKRSAASRWKYGRAAHFIAVSEFVKNVLLDGGVNADRISVVYDGVPLPPEPAASADRRVVAIDSGDPLKGRALIEKTAELARVPIHFSRDLMSDLPSASLFVYITESEGLGSAALLASAHGVPVVASHVGGLCEAVEDGVTGVLTPNDPAAIASAISRILDNPTLGHEMGAAGRKRVAERFTIEAMVRGTLAVYERVLACSRP